MRQVWQKNSGLGVVLVTMLLAGCIPRSNAPQPRISTANEVPAWPGPLLETDDGALVAPPRPTWDGADVVRRSRSVAGAYYVVRPGDTLRTIGSRTGAGSEAIAAANRLTPPYTIVAGQRLAIPGGLYHSVSAGETGIGIARAYGVGWSDMVALNGLEEPYILRVGQRLRLPGGAQTVAVNTAAASSPGQGGYTPSAPRSVDRSALERRAAAFTIGIDDIVTGSQPALAEGRRATAAIAKPAAAVKTAIAQPGMFDGSFLWPVRGRTVSSFGSNKDGRINDGVNIAAKLGTPVMAAGSGVVAYSGDEITVFGGLILIDHGGGWITAYGHLGQLDVVRGEKVHAGERIGTVGQTGYVTEPQLHFEIRQKRTPVDPLQKLPRV